MNRGLGILYCLRGVLWDVGLAGWIVGWDGFCGGGLGWVIYLTVVMSSVRAKCHSLFGFLYRGICDIHVRD